MRPSHLLLLLCSLSLVAATCSQQQTASYLGLDQGQSKHVDYAILLDRSGSMQGEKLDTMKNAAKALVDLLPSTDRASIISFNYQATLDQPLTADHDKLKAAIDQIQASFSTRYKPPLDLADQELASSPNNKALIFLTDGVSDFAEPPQEILSLIEGVAQKNVCIMTISYGLNGSENPLLGQMAAQGEAHGCGAAFQASEKGTELQEVFTHIHQTVSALDVFTLKSRLSPTDYQVQVWSTANGKPVPGKDLTGCVDEPTILTHVKSNNTFVSDLKGPAGQMQLPDGTYTYTSSAFVNCGGTCDFSGTESGNFTVGGTCQAQYTDLASYVTGETQTVLITPTGFSPQTVSGREGTLIVWKNIDTVSHHISSPYFDQVLAPQQTYTYAIGNVGTLLYTDPDRNVTGSLAALSGAGTDLLLVIDESGSMAGPGITEAQAAAQKFFSLLSPADRGALITFSGSAFLLQDFTSDTSALLAATSGLRAEGATAYLSALQLASTLQPSQQGVLVFMTDGVPTDPQGENAIIQATNDLRRQGWCTMMVGFGEEGAQAKSLLTRMAGGDECSAFLYAANGRLAETFGTIYQISKHNSDLTFTSVHAPFITFSSSVPLSLQVMTRTGKLVPSGTEEYCAPAALVQASTSGGAIDLPYNNNVYTGVLNVQPGIESIHLVATVQSTDESGRVFTGSQTLRVLVIPPMTMLLLIVLLAGIIIAWKRIKR